MLELKLIHVSKRGPRSVDESGRCVIHRYQQQCDNFTIHIAAILTVVPETVPQKHYPDDPDGALPSQ